VAEIQGASLDSISSIHYQDAESPTVLVDVVLS